MATIDIPHLSDEALLVAARQAAANERGATVHLVALLAELDARRLYLGLGCASLFAYCTRILRLSEHAAYHRIETARAARQFPAILDRLAAGEVTLTTIGLLRPHLTAENHVALLDAARHQSKREVERLVASLAPRTDVAPLIRRLPVLVRPLSVAAATSASVVPEATSELATGPDTPLVEADANRPGQLESSAAAGGHARVANDAMSPGAGDRYLLRLTISGETFEKLQRARDLMRHGLPTGDPAAVIDRALTVLIDQLQRAKFAATPRPRPARSHAGSTRYIPAAVKRSVWTRDAGRCTFVGAEGRCRETGGLEFHHVTPFAHGGSTDVDNLTLRCRAHNAYDARLVFGDPPLLSRASSE